MGDGAGPRMAPRRRVVVMPGSGSHNQYVSAVTDAEWEQQSISEHLQLGSGTESDGGAVGSNSSSSSTAPLTSLDFSAAINLVEWEDQQQAAYKAGLLIGAYELFRQPVS